jgi:hypothetical protein
LHLDAIKLSHILILNPFFNYNFLKSTYFIIKK